MTTTIVMIHGMWGSGEQWANYRAFFEERGFEVLTPTLRHHVRGSRDVNPALATTSLLDYAADLEEEIRALPEQPVIMGHSMGGLLAQILCARGLGRAGIFLTPAAPRGIVALTPSVLRTFARVLTTWGFWRSTTFPTFGEVHYAIYNLLPEEEARVEYESLTCESGRATFEIGLWPFDPRRASAVDETRIQSPLLVVGATHDRITPVSVVRRVAQKYAARCEYRELPDHAHWILGGAGWDLPATSCADWISRL